MRLIINLITISRIFFAFFIYLFLINPDTYLLALIFFFLSSFSDYIDGYLARKFSATSLLGEVLDPIADKILIVFVFLGLSVNLESNFVGFLTSIIISREIWVAALRDLSSRYNNSNATKVTFLAKIKTTVQMITALIYITGLLINNFLMILIGDIFLVIATLITVYTGFQYTFKTFNKK